jgi:FkbM family methyltransferase
MNQLLLTLAAWVARITPLRAKKAIYRINPLASLIRRSLNRAAPAGLSQTIVAAGPMRGVHLYLDLQTEKDYWLGTYEADLLQAIGRTAQKGMIAYDLGANIGYLTLYLAHLVGENGHVYAFEALPENLARLEANLKINALTTRVTAVPQAVADQTGPVEFLIGPSGGMGKIKGAAGRQIKYQRSMALAGISLDDFVYHEGHPPPQIIKMDIEGGEVKAFMGMSHILQSARPLIYLELHGPTSAQVAWQSLHAADYEIFQLTPDSPRVDHVKSLDWKSYLLAKPVEGRKSDR